MSIRTPRALIHLGAATFAVFVLSAGATEPGAPEGAQPPPGTQPPMDSQPPTDAQPPAAVEGEVSDEKLQQFAEAAAEVQKIQEDYAAKAQSLQKATEEKIVSSVQEAGMSVAEFTAIVERMQSDPSLARRLDGLEVE